MLGCVMCNIMFRNGGSCCASFGGGVSLNWVVKVGFRVAGGGGFPGRFRGVDMKQISELVRKARRDNEYSQTELGEMMGKSRAWVVRIEGCNPGTYDAMLPLHWAQLELHLGIEPGGLLRFTGIPQDEWPGVARESIIQNQESNSSSNYRWVYVGDLTHTQAKILTDTATEFRSLNSGENRT